MEPSESSAVIWRQVNNCRPHQTCNEPTCYIIRSYLEPSESSGPSGINWSIWSEAIRSYLELYSVLSDAIWSYLGPSGAIFGYLVLSGAK